MKRLPILVALLVSPVLFSGCEAFIERTCEQMTGDLDSELNQALNTHNACSEDSGCVAVSISTACRGACPVAVKASAQEAFEANMDDIDQRLCIVTQFAQVCGFATPGCVSAQAQCVNGRCEMVD